MALQSCSLTVNREKKELKPHGTPAFPCAGYQSAPRMNIDDAIPWHWHKEFEVILVAEGTLRLNVLAEQFLPSEGDIAVINSNALHMANGAPYCVLHSLVFSSLLITGTEDSDFATRYITPLIASPAFNCVILHDDKLAQRYDEAFAALRDDTPGFEFAVRDALSAVMMEVFRQVMPTLQAQQLPRNPDAHRVARMISYIQMHYAEKMTLGEIAQVCGISERETLRCFKRNIGESPIQYLLKYRLYCSAEKLESQADMPISAIAGACGFDSSAYFSKQFKTLYGCTPQHYRKNRSNAAHESESLQSL